MEEKELRVLSTADFGVEKRTIKRDDGSETEVDVITGKAVTFNQLSQSLGWFREQIDARAFDGCDMSDSVALKNHDGNILLGRTPDTLVLDVRADGLYFTAYPPNTQAARDCIEEIRGKMIRGCSFQFTIAPGGSDWDTDPETGGDIRTVKKIAKLYDVGPVTFPAYLQTNTDVAKRDFESVRQQRDALKQEQEDSQQQHQQEMPTVTVAPLSVYERQLQLLKQP